MSEKAGKFREATEKVKEKTPSSPPPNTGSPDPQRSYDGR